MTTLEEVTTVPKEFQLPHPSELEDENQKQDRLYTIPDLVEFLLNVPTRASFVTFRSRTTPRMRKTDNPYWNADSREWNIRKISIVNGIINFIYANSVENQRERERLDLEEFEPQLRRWGNRILNTPLVRHKGRYYLEVKVENVFETTYVDSNGVEIDREEIDEFLYSSSQPSTQKTEKEIILRDYKIENLEQIKMYGDVFNLH